VTKDVLVVGSGAREHALAWKLSQSPGMGTIYVAPGNPGTAAIATNLSIGVSDFDALRAAIDEHRIDLTIVGPEDPLANGLSDYLTRIGHPVFGPSSDGARIESSKSWAKEIMSARNVPTGAAVRFDELEHALDYIYDAPLPLVLKADGLAAGKGVMICHSRDEAQAAARSMLGDRALGDAGGTVLIEEFLTGMEVSLLAITDGQSIVPLIPACDYKRVGNNDTGPNTGGMGAYAPPAAAGPGFVAEVIHTIIAPVLEEMRARGITYRGVLYAGLILTEDGPKVIEFNCRFGDPETQVILPMLDFDFLKLCDATARGELATLPDLRWHDGACVGVILAASGYPGSYRSSDPISGLDSIPNEGMVFHAGTRFDDGQVVTAGGRVLTAVGRGSTMQIARDLAYQTASAISFDGAFHRDDIAQREV
jgi:phosphoribosylamine---glycine ligase